MTSDYRTRPLRAMLLTTLAGSVLSACATTADAQTRSGTSQQITQAEAQQGAQANQQIIQEFGGAMTGPQAAYVETIGKNIAVRSGLGNARESFNVAMLNSSVNNAFAIPGGYIYTTRQLVALMNNEAELAGVLGHEVAHVAARHSQRRQQTAQRNSILGAIGSILSGVVLGNSGIGQAIGQSIQQGSQLLTLRFSRSQELEADRLGQQYLVSAGYDPHAMATVLESLALQNNLDARLQGRSASVPEWASTHPDPAGRVNTANRTAGNRTGLLNRDTFLTRIDGLLYGDDPKQGVIEGQQFVHPDLQLAFAAPNGFYMVNGTQAVSINGQSGQAQMTTAPYSGSLESYVYSAFQQVGGGQNSQLRPTAVQRTTVNGIPAAYATARANTNNGQVDVTIFAYEFARNRAYHFQAITRGARERFQFHVRFNAPHHLRPKRVVSFRGGSIS